MLQRDSLGCKISFSLVRNMSITHDFFFVDSSKLQTSQNVQEKKIWLQIKPGTTRPLLLIKNLEIITT